MSVYCNTRNWGHDRALECSPLSKTEVVTETVPYDTPYPHTITWDTSHDRSFKCIATTLETEVMTLFACACMPTQAHTSPPPAHICTQTHTHTYTHTHTHTCANSSETERFRHTAFINILVQRKRPKSISSIETGSKTSSAHWQTSTNLIDKLLARLHVVRQDTMDVLQCVNLQSVVVKYPHHYPRNHEQERRHWNKKNSKYKKWNICNRSL